MACGKKGVYVFLFLCLLSSAIAADRLIINSREWQDVYAGLLYGNLVGTQPYFLTTEADSTIVLNTMAANDDILIFTSKRSPFVFGYGPTVQSLGYSQSEEKNLDSMSLELAKELENVSKYVIIDDSYGYNAIAVAPYALASGSFVVFADRTNIVEVEDFFDQKNPDEILVYGHVDREVLESLDRFNPEIINEDGDRFANNVEIVKKYMEIKEVGQVMLSNGEFIERSLMTGQYPTLFIGRDNVPDKIKDFVKNSPINTGVLVGNDLVSTATVVRRELGISVFVKFARSARQPDGPIAQVEDLDLFFVPRISFSLNISNVRYNKITRQIEVTYRNNADVATYFKGSYTLVEGDNQQSFGDLEAIFIAPNSFKTLVYDVEPVASEEALLDVFTIFGESKDSLELILDGQFDVSFVDVRDDTQIQYNNVYYDITNQRFVVLIENVGQTDAYVDTEIIDLYLLRERTTLSSESIVKVSPGKVKKVYIPVELSEEDIENNPSIRVRSYYGERENALIKILEGEFEMVTRKATFITYLPTILLVILVLLVLLTITKKKCENCGHKNHRHKKKCKKCGSSLK